MSRIRVPVVAVSLEPVTEIHATPCALCPSAHYPPSEEVEDIHTWPRDLQIESAFPCAWRPEKLCRGYCDELSITDSDARARKNGGDK